MEIHTSGGIFVCISRLESMVYLVWPAKDHWFKLADSFFCLERGRNMLEIWCRTFFDSKTWLVSGDILCLWQRVGTRFFHPRDDSRSMGPWHVRTSSSLGGQLLKGHVDMGNVIRGYVTMDERYIKNQDGAIPILGRIISQWRRSILNCSGLSSPSLICKF